ncbi:MAG: AmmeMemoRadiSam system radical SAM enzyme [Nanobdellota archaeon]
MKEASFYRTKADKVQCYLCPHVCSIGDGERGKCRVRQNIKGKLYSLVYGKLIAQSVDPIEKKPLFHFCPHTKSYSIATVGCNLSCDFCQNWDISQPEQIVGEDATPEQVVESAIHAGCKSISYTYTEPTIFLEFAHDCAKRAKECGLANVFVSNGFITKPAIDGISPYLDAINIDLKGFSEGFYQDTCHGSFKPVLDAIRYYHEKGVFVELTTLIVPGHNDSEDMLKQIVDFILSIDKRIPWHISRFFPLYRMSDAYPTPLETLEKAYKVGKQKGLDYIYLGNVPSDMNTYCPGCHRLIVDREKHETTLVDGNCPDCGAPINISCPGSQV